jgi:CHAD domain-containing protein
MAFRLRNGDHVAEDVRRIAEEQVAGALADLSAGDHEDPDTVHELRKRCKKVRAVLRLIRPALGHAYDVENAHFRDAARSLSPLRDAHTAIVAYDALLDHYHGEVQRRSFAAIRRGLVLAEERCKRNAADLEDRFARVRTEMEAARHRIDDWPIADLGVGTWRDGFEATYRLARKAMAAAYDDPTPERFHEWRKAVKYHGYHVHLLRPMWDDQLRARGATADALSELLGAYHDVVVLGSTLHGNGTRTLRRLIDRRRGDRGAGEADRDAPVRREATPDRRAACPLVERLGRGAAMSCLGRRRPGCRPGLSIKTEFRGVSWRQGDS